MNTDLVPIPSASAMMTAIGSSSAPVFNELLPIGLFGIGVIVGGLIVYGLISWVIRGIGAVTFGHHEPTKYDV